MSEMSGPITAAATQAIDLMIMGDSITLGASEVRGSTVVHRVEQGYVDWLQRAHPALRIAIDADVHRTTTTLLPRLPAALAQHQPRIVLVMLGGNDVDIDWRRFILSKGRIVRNNVAIERYARNLRTIAELIHAGGAVPILSDMPNHDVSLRGPYFSRLAECDVVQMLIASGGQEESDRRWQIYLQMAGQVAQETGAVPFAYGVQLHQHPSSLTVGPDMVHPSAAAHQLIAEMLIPVIARCLSD